MTNFQMIYIPAPKPTLEENSSNHNKILTFSTKFNNYFKNLLLPRLLKDIKMHTNIIICSPLNNQLFQNGHLQHHLNIRQHLNSYKKKGIHNFT